MSTSPDTYLVAISASVAIPVAAPVAGAQSGEDCCADGQAYMAMTAGEFGNTLVFVPTYAGPLDNACARGYIDFSAFAAGAGSVTLFTNGPNCKLKAFPCEVAPNGSSVSYTPTNPADFAAPGQYQSMLVMYPVDTTVYSVTGDGTDITATSCPVLDVRNIEVGMPLQLGIAPAVQYTTVESVTPDTDDNSGVITYAALTTAPVAAQRVRSGPQFSQPFTITVSAPSLACATCA